MRRRIFWLNALFPSTVNSRKSPSYELTVGPVLAQPSLIKKGESVQMLRKNFSALRWVSTGRIGSFWL